MTEEAIAEAEAPAPAAAPSEPVPPAPQVLLHPRLPDENDGDYLIRTRGMVVRSELPADVVPNTPQIIMSAQAVEFETPATGEGASEEA